VKTERIICGGVDTLARFRPLRRNGRWGWVCAHCERRVRVVVTS
jgi:hypothetical protein